jgi:cholesterol transport system auxiliary component
LVRGRTKFDYFANSLWTDRVPVLVQTLLIEAFEGDGSITQVGRDAQDLTPDYLLATEVRRFEAVYDDGADRPPTAVVALALGLVKMPDHRMLARTLVQEQSPSSSNNVESVVEAFDVALGKILLQCVAWTNGAVRKAR